MPRRPPLARSWTAITMGPRRQMLVAEAATMLIVARVRTATRPFTTIGRRFGTFMLPTDPRVTERRTTATMEDAAVARRIGWAIRKTAPLMPFRAACLQQAMAAHAMLSRRGVASVVHLGVPGGAPAPAQTHAWLDAAGVAVVGYPIGATIVEIGCFT